jgi:hypothetical protein
MNRMTQAVMGDPRGAGVAIGAYTAVATGAGTPLENHSENN